MNYKYEGDTLQRSWLRHYATSISRNIAGSIPNEVIRFFDWPNPSRCTMALGSTQSRNLPGGKGRPARRADNLTVISEPIF
jgi:hypothetical protein